MEAIMGLNINGKLRTMTVSLLRRDKSMVGKVPRGEDRGGASERTWGFVGLPVT